MSVPVHVLEYKKKQGEKKKGAEKGEQDVIDPQNRVWLCLATDCGKVVQVVQNDLPCHSLWQGKPYSVQSCSD